MTAIGCIQLNAPIAIRLVMWGAIPERCKELLPRHEPELTSPVTTERAFNDMLYLCEKYAPLSSLGKYDPEKDISITGTREVYDVMAGANPSL